MRWSCCQSTGRRSTDVEKGAGGFEDLVGRAETLRNPRLALHLGEKLGLQRWRRHLRVLERLQVLHPSWERSGN